MKYNDKTPEITVNPETYEVRVDGAVTVSYTHLDVYKRQDSEVPQTV